MAAGVWNDRPSIVGARQIAVFTPIAVDAEIEALTA